MKDERIRILLAEAEEHRAEAAEHLHRAAAAQVAYQAARDQVDAASADAIDSYDDYLRRYLPDEWERQHNPADPAAEGERRAKRAIACALEALLGEVPADER